jgi:hypothetical protein
MDEALQHLLFAAILFSLVEWIASLLMMPWAFRLGLPVVRCRVPAPEGALASCPAVPPTMKLRAAGPSEWIFRHAASLSNWQAPIGIVSTAVLSGRELRFVGRAPLGLVIAVAALAASIGHWSAWACAGAACVIAWLIERPRFESEAIHVARALLPEG